MDDVHGVDMIVLVAVVIGGVVILVTVVGAVDKVATDVTLFQWCCGNYCCGYFFLHN